MGMIIHLYSFFINIISPQVYSFSYNFWFCYTRIIDIKITRQGFEKRVVSQDLQLWLSNVSWLLYYCSHSESKVLRLLISNSRRHHLMEIGSHSLLELEDRYLCN